MNTRTAAVGPDGVVRRTFKLVAVIPFIIAGCSDPVTAPAHSATSATAVANKSSVRTVQSATPADAQMVAHGIALALNDPAIRSQVRDAMRASVVNEHKLVLQDFVRTANGQNLLTAAAASLKLTPTTFQKTMADLPRMDFYAPFETHRLTWRGTPDVLVATTFGDDAPTVTGYGTDGSTVTLQKAQGVPTAPVLILHPEEPKAQRDGPQSNTPGNVIQDAGDGTSASSYTPPGGVVSFASSSPRRAPTETTTSLLFNSVSINHFNVQEGDGWGFGSLEMQFQSYALSGPVSFLSNGTILTTNSCPLGTYARDGVNEDQGYDGLWTITPSVSLFCGDQVGWYAVHIVEIDGSTSDNDDYGWRFYQAGGYPNGAAYGVVESFYAETIHSTRTAYPRLVYN